MTDRNLRGKGSKTIEEDLRNLERTLTTDFGMERRITPLELKRVNPEGEFKGMFEMTRSYFSYNLSHSCLLNLDEGTPGIPKLEFMFGDEISIDEQTTPARCINRIKKNAGGPPVAFELTSNFWIQSRAKIFNADSNDNKEIFAGGNVEVEEGMYYIFGVPLTLETLDQKLKEAREWVSKFREVREKEWKSFRDLRDNHKKKSRQSVGLNDSYRDMLVKAGYHLMAHEASWLATLEKIKDLERVRNLLGSRADYHAIFVGGEIVDLVKSPHFKAEVLERQVSDPKMALYKIFECDKGNYRGGEYFFDKKKGCFLPVKSFYRKIK